MATLISREIAGNWIAASLFRQADEKGSDLSVTLTNLTEAGNTSTIVELLIAEPSVARLATPVITDQGSQYLSIPEIQLSTSVIPDKRFAAIMEIDTVTCETAGIYYRVNDILSLPAGDGTIATIKVTSVNASGRIVAFTILTRGAYTSLVKDQHLVRPIGGSGREAIFKLTHRLSKIELVGTPDLGNDDPVVVIQGNAKATIDVTFALEPRHRVVRKDLAPNEYLVVKDLSLGKGETIVVRAKGGSLAGRVMS